MKVAAYNEKLLHSGSSERTLALLSSMRSNRGGALEQNVPLARVTEQRPQSTIPPV